MRYLFLFVFLSAFLFSCEEETESKFDEEEQREITLADLFTIYQGGEILECKDGDDLVYCCAVSDDSPKLYFYEKDGSYIAKCNKNATIPNEDDFCQYTSFYSCDFIYRSKSHKDGFLDEYEISK